MLTCDYLNLECTYLKLVSSINKTEIIQGNVIQASIYFEWFSKWNELFVELLYFHRRLLLTILFYLAIRPQGKVKLYIVRNIKSNMPHPHWPYWSHYRTDDNEIQKNFRALLPKKAVKQLHSITI